MNSVTRILNTLALKPVDYVPVIPLIIQHSLDLAHVTNDMYCQHSSEMTKALMALQDYYNFDSIYVSSDNFIYAQAFGGDLIFPHDATPQLATHPFEKELPKNMPKLDFSKGRMHVILESTDILREHYNESIFIKTNIDSAPFSTAASLRSPEKLMLDLYDETDRLHDLLKMSTDAVISYGFRAAEAGAHGLAFGDSVAGLLNHELYQNFVLPYTRFAIQVLKNETNLPIFYHICGNTNHILDLMIETGADCIEVDSTVDLDKCQFLAQGKCAIEGNIDTINTFYQGTPADVRKAANNLLKRFENTSGFILSSGCEIPRYTPTDNISEMVRSAKEFKYSINIK